MYIAYILLSEIDIDYALCSVLITFKSKFFPKFVRVTKYVKFDPKFACKKPNSDKGRLIS